MEGENPITRLLKWLESIPTLYRRHKRKQVIREAFARARPMRWLSLGLLTRELGLDDQDKDDLDETAGLLASLHAHPDKKPESRDKPRQQQLWTLGSAVDK